MTTRNYLEVSKEFTRALKLAIEALNATINVVGLIATNDKPSLAYARATKKKFNQLGINYDLRTIPRLELEEEITRLNADSSVHGVFIYFPIFFNHQDDYLRNLVDFRKDIEAGSQYWTQNFTKMIDLQRTLTAPRRLCCPAPLSPSSRSLPRMESMVNLKWENQSLARSSRFSIAVRLLAVLWRS